MEAKELIVKRHVYKMSGAGNLFYVIDNDKMQVSVKKFRAVSKELCETGKAFTPEGVMFINSCNVADFEVRFYNPDGTTGMMCGNGGRCAVRFAIEKSYTDKQTGIEFEMAKRIYRADIIDGEVAVYLAAPTKQEKRSIVLTGESEDMNLDGTYIRNGTEHFCCNIEDIKSLTRVPLDLFPLMVFGKRVRYHKAFLPKGTNFNIFRITGKNEIHLRTYERGVERETGACGTGAVASAYCAVEAGCEFPVRVIPTSGIPIYVDDKSKIKMSELRGHAEFI